MRIGVPKEIKVHEYRVGLTPNGAAELVAAGHEVFVETRAGDGVGFYDADYEKAGARILDSAGAVFETAELIVKVKEPQPVDPGTKKKLGPPAAKSPRQLGPEAAKSPRQLLRFAKRK